MVLEPHEKMLIRQLFTVGSWCLFVISAFHQQTFQILTGHFIGFVVLQFILFTYGSKLS